MKALLWVILLVAVPSTSLPQGKVAFGNDGDHLFGRSVFDGIPLPIPVSPLPDGSMLIAALYAGNGTAGNNLVLATSYPLDASGWLAPGRMITHGISIPGLIGGQVDTLAVIVGDRVGAVGSAYVPDLPAAIALGYGYYGTSGLFQMTPGTSLVYPSICGGGGSTWAPAPLEVHIIPEPAVGSLVGLGIGILVLFRRGGRSKRSASVK